MRGSASGVRVEDVLVVGLDGAPCDDVGLEAAVLGDDVLYGLHTPVGKEHLRGGRALGGGVPGYSYQWVI